MPAEQSFLGPVCQHTGSGVVHTGLSDAYHNTNNMRFHWNIYPHISQTVLWQSRSLCAP